MRDSNEKIHYLGFQSILNGGRQLQFSVDTATQADVILSITIAGSFFSGFQRLSFQDAPAVCRTKLRQNLDAGTLQTTKPIELTSDDIAQYREFPRRRGH